MNSWAFQVIFSNVEGVHEPEFRPLLRRTSAFRDERKWVKFLPYVVLMVAVCLYTVSCRTDTRKVAPTSTPRPESALLWLEDMTTKEVAQALEQGRDRIIVPTGGVEQNGPHVVLAKHNIILEITCERVAKDLGDVLLAPVIKYVPEGRIEPPDGHMTSPGTLSLRPETFRATLVDVVSSLRAHGFRQILLLGDSGGNQADMKAVAESLDAQWDNCRVAYIAEYYNYQDTRRWLREQGIQEVPDNIHEEVCFSAQLMVYDPGSIRFEQRQDERGGVVIKGHRFQSAEDLRSLGEKIIQRRVSQTIQAINALDS